MTYLEMAYRTLKTFGFFDGSVVVAAVVASRLLPSSGQKLKKLRITGLSRPLFVRLGTSDRSVLQQVFIGREYECPSQAHNQAVREFYEDALSRSKTPVIVDCGANIGLASLWYNFKFPRAKIIAVEPEPENFRILTMNVTGYSNIRAVHGAVSDRETRVSLSNSANEQWAWETTESDAGAVPTYTIPGLTETLSDSELMIVKIDIEGGEVALFRSNVGWVPNTPVIVFEAHDWLFNWRATFHAVASVLTNHARDYVQSGENMFSFSHALLAHRRACP